MKKSHWLCFVLALILCAVGIGCRNCLIVLDKVFVILGVALFLFVFVKHCFSKAQRCPNCNAIIYSGHIRTITSQKDGIVPCEKCGSLVRVNHSKVDKIAK